MEMKEYMAPEMEVVELKMKTVLMAGSPVLDDDDETEANPSGPGVTPPPGSSF
jgi:hypothetical protein